MARDWTIERLRPSGGWIIAEVIDGARESRRYFGYTKAEAMAAFRAEFPKRRKAASHGNA